jgi:hypothetical protein
MRMIGDIIFWLVWIPICILLMLGVIVFAYANLIWNYIKNIFKNDR